MKKIIIADDLKSLVLQEDSFLLRGDMRVVGAASNEEALEIHKGVRADLIIVTVDSPGLDVNSFCNTIRSREDLREVSIIVVNISGRSGVPGLAGCKANAVISAPASLALLLDKAHQLLHISRRGSYRAPVSVRVQGEVAKRPFLCHSENLSASGMLFETDRNLSGGDAIFCSFLLPDTTRIQADAEIVRVVERPSEFDTRQYGARFSQIGEGCRAAIEAYIAGWMGRR